MERIVAPSKQGLYDPAWEHDACGIGFVADIKGRKSHTILQQALKVLVNLDHRGARGAEVDTGDGAGVLLQIPHTFLARECSRLGIDLPAAGTYAVGMLFLPHDEKARQFCERVVEEVAAAEQLRVLGWRTVPVDDSSLGETARRCRPYVRQVFVAPQPEWERRWREEQGADPLVLERRLYVVRRRAKKEVQACGLPPGETFYFASFSARTIVYKGMLTPQQLPVFYPELTDPAMTTALALVHSRFSTNTFPSWERAHPYRYLIHNGEINTLRGNVNWMHARQALCASPLWGDDLAKVLPVIDPNGSDSAMMDNCFEFLVLSGRSLPHVAMMMIPEPWEKDEFMSATRRAFYEYHSCLMEPWDGPAAVAFTDGTVIGAVLDRNGLRPSRYWVTSDDIIVLASESGVLPVQPEKIILKERLRPGRMLLVDTAAGRIIPDEEIKEQIATAQPYREWIDRYLISFNDLQAKAKELQTGTGNNSLSVCVLPAEAAAPGLPVTAGGDPVAPAITPVLASAAAISSVYKNTTTIDTPGVTVGKKELIIRQKMFGYTHEDLLRILEPMARHGVEAVGSMGNDAPPPVLSKKPRLLYEYFRQLFAQVTNPPVDSIREEIVFSTTTYLGPERNLIQPEPESCRRIKLEGPLLKDEELSYLCALNLPGFKCVVLPIFFPAGSGSDGLKKALNGLFAAAEQAIAEGATLLLLSDRQVDAANVPIPALLAVSGLHHHLIRRGLRTRVSILLESGEPREIHHLALLIGYGADAINPYLALATVADLVQRGYIKEVSAEKAQHNYLKAALKGIVKVMSKMGISTIQSYRGAQIFEAIGLGAELVDNYFTWTPSRLGGVGLDVIAREAEMRHRDAFAGCNDFYQQLVLPSGSSYQWRSEGEARLFNPQTIALLQQACREGNYELFKQYSRLVNEQRVTLRSWLRFKSNRSPVPIEEVEPVESICRRFKTGAMSFGSISKEAHETLAIAMNRLGGKSNTGEGGEDPARYTPDPNGDSRRSAIKQVASGRFGVTSLYLVNADEIQIKIAQGAKPGEGGQLPGAKVYPWVARVRGTTAGVGLISPPPHHDIYSIEDLAQLIFDLKNANPKARINVKLVSEVGVGTIAAGVAKGHADVILISGADGGTGAAPRTSINHAGLPWELGLAETHQTLILNNLRDRVVLETDGKLLTGRDVAIAALLGAEEYGFATAPLVVLGCVMMRVCNLDSCPCGIATQNPELRKNFRGDPQHVINFMRFVAQEMREIMAELGFRTVNEMIGRTDVLEVDPAIAGHWKARYLDLSPLLYQPPLTPGTARYCIRPQDHGLERTLDQRVLIALSQPALTRGEKVEAVLEINNTDRAVGTMLGSEVTRRYGEKGLPEDTIVLHFKGSAGQSFGAFLPPGITLYLEGDANDYFGKGLSGGKLIVYPPANARFVAEENIIVGNVSLYGATGGEAYVCGLAGERFAVRNSGAVAVVEGVGDHGCEYMTGGRVVIIGRTGRNFAAGMTGGIAYVLDEDGLFERRCNKEMVLLEELVDEDEAFYVKNLIERHVTYTGSQRGRWVLANWQRLQKRFVKVIPRDYKRMLAAIERAHRSGLSGEEAIMAAFYENLKDEARVSGN